MVTGMIVLTVTAALLLGGELYLRKTGKFASRLEGGNGRARIFRHKIQYEPWLWSRPPNFNFTYRSREFEQPFSTNADGSTKWIFVQLSGLNGFAVVDFAARKEINRIKNPDLPPGKSTVPAGSDPSHGMAVTADGKTLVVCSRLNNYLYAYSLPDLKSLGGAELGGKGAAWVTLTPDGKTAYVANPVTNDVSVIDIKSLKEVTRIPVGFVPKRNTTGLLP